MILCFIFHGLKVNPGGNAHHCISLAEFTGSVANMSDPAGVHISRPLFVCCVYISGGVHHSDNALCCPLRPFDPGCDPARVNGRYQSLPPYRLQAAQQSWGEKLCIVCLSTLRDFECEALPFCSLLLYIWVLNETELFKSMLTQWTATKYAENLKGWIFFFCQCLFTVYCFMLHSSIAELMCAL